MADERTSFDVRTERLNLIASRTAGSPLADKPGRHDSASEDVDDWIKSVRALKEKRKAEDEARNRQLEEDILRERKARQERRATRTRSVSPTKSLHEAVSANISPATSTRRNILNESPKLPPKTLLGSPELSHERKSLFTEVEHAPKSPHASDRQHTDAGSQNMPSRDARSVQREQPVPNSQHEFTAPVPLLDDRNSIKLPSRLHSPDASGHQDKDSPTSVRDANQKPVKAAALSSPFRTQLSDTITLPAPAVKTPSRYTSKSPEAVSSPTSPSRWSTRNDGTTSGVTTGTHAKPILPARHAHPSTTNEGSETLSSARQGLRSTNTSRAVVPDHVKATLMTAKTSLKSSAPATVAKPHNMAATLAVRTSSLMDRAAARPESQITRQHSAPISNSEPLSSPKQSSFSPLLPRHESVPISQERSRSSAVSVRANPNLAAMLQRGPVMAKTSSAGKDATSIQRPDSTQDSDAPTSKLQHMTKHRARRPKTAAPSQNPKIAVSEESIAADLENPKQPTKVDERPNAKALASTPQDQSNNPPIVTRLPARTETVIRSQKSTMPQSDTQSHLKSSDNKIRMKSIRNEVEYPASTNRIIEKHDSPRARWNNESAEVDAPAPRSPFSARSISPFKSSPSKHLPSKSVSSMTGIADIIRGRAGRSDNKDSSASQQPSAAAITVVSPAKESPAKESQTKGCQVWRMSQRTQEFKLSTQEPNVLCEDEVLLIRFRNDDVWYQWIGNEYTQDADEDVRKVTKESADVRKILMGEETPDFISRLKGSIVVCKRGASEIVENELMSVRKYMDGYAADQVACNASSLCSGFIYIVIRKNLPCTIWVGKGSFPEEHEAARAILSQFGKAEGACIVHEGQETTDFWTLVGGQARYASSSYWRLRKDFPSYKTDLWTVESAKVVRHKVWSFESMVPPKVHIMDCFFELYIYLSTTNEKEDIIIALNWIKDFCKQLAQSRPFVPMALILCPGSKFPRDLKATFRSPVRDGADLRVLEVESAELLLSRSRFRYDEILSGTVIGHDLTKLDQFVDAQDFELAMGISKQSFERLSASEQREIRVRALDKLSRSGQK